VVCTVAAGRGRGRVYIAYNGVCVYREYNTEYNTAGVGRVSQVYRKNNILINRVTLSNVLNEASTLGSMAPCCLRDRYIEIPSSLEHRERPVVPTPVLDSN